MHNQSSQFIQNSQEHPHYLDNHNQSSQKGNKPLTNQERIYIKTVTQHPTILQNFFGQDQLQKSKCPNKQVIKSSFDFTVQPDTMRINHKRPNQLILVYLMHREHKLSLFLDKGVAFEQLLRKMYREIYIFQKETYSISNSILKTLLYKVTGFQSIDNDLMFQYNLKYNRGKFQKQKFFTPFKQQDLKMPFKIQCKIQQNIFGGNQFLVRNYSDGEWAILTSIKKHSIQQEKANSIKRSLKSNFNSCSILLKNSPSHFSQINWFESKHHIFIVSEYFVQTFQNNLEKNKQLYSKQESTQIFKFITKWFAHVLKQLVQCNIQSFRRISLPNIILNPEDGMPKISILDNVSNCLDLMQRRKSVVRNIKRVSQKITDRFYQQTFLNFIESLKLLFIKQGSNMQQLEDLITLVCQLTNSQVFSFDQILKLLTFCENNVAWETTLKLKPKNPLKVDFNSKMQKIIQNPDNLRSLNYSSAGKPSISQIKQQIHRTFSMQNMRKNQQRTQGKSMLQTMLTSMNLSALKKQNTGNTTEFNKQEQRKFRMKTKEKLYIQQIINELNQNQNFIKTTKQNNLASIEFYLKKSDDKIKKKMMGKIQKKYKKFFEKKQTIEDENQHMENNQNKFVNFTLAEFTNPFSSPQAGKPLSFRQSELIQSKSSTKESHFFSMCNRKLKKNYSLQKNHIKRSQPILKRDINQKLNFLIKKSQRSLQNSQRPKQQSVSFRTKTNESTPNLFCKKKSRLQQLFLNSRDQLKDQKLVLKKKQYGIYLEQAQKQYNQIKMYKKTTANQAK